MKKLLALVLALVMTLGLATVGTSAAYSDANDIEYTEAADVMTAVGVFQGKGDAFAPKDNLNRAEAAKLVAYLMLGNKTAEAMKGSGAKFADVPASHWASGYIEYLATAGVVSGVGGGNFDPNGQVTAVQFAKMLLVALGYDAEIEGFTGNSSWAINIQKLANDNDLYDLLDDLSSTAALTREQAAQMCLNDLKADMVEYEDKGTTVNVGGATVVTGAKKAKEVSSNNNNRYNGEYDSVKQLCEDLYGNDLKLADSSDDLGRPANKWTYKAKDVGTYANKSDLLVSTDSKIKKNAMYDLVGKDAYNNMVDGDDVIYVYVDGGARIFVNDPATYTTDTLREAEVKKLFDKDSTANAGNGQAYVTGNGTLYELYLEEDYDGNNNDKYTLIVAHTYLVRATADYNTSNESVKVEFLDGNTNVKPTKFPTEIENDDFAVSDVKKDDYMLVTYSQNTGDFQTVKKATVLEGKVSSFVVDDTVTIDGTKHSYSATIAANAAHGTSVVFNIGSTVKVVLDQNDNVIYVDDAEVSSSYLYIKSAAANSLRTKVEAEAFFTDGTSKTITVKKATYYDGNTLNVTGAAGRGTTLQAYDVSNVLTLTTTNGTTPAQYLRGQWYTYSVDDNGEYTLKTVGSAGTTTTDTRDTNPTSAYANTGYTQGVVYYAKEDDTTTAGAVNVLDKAAVDFAYDYVVTTGTPDTIDNQSKAGALANNDTKIIFYDKDKDITVYDGVANIPGVSFVQTNSSHATGDIVANVSYVLDSGYVKYAFVDVSDVTTALTTDDTTESKDYAFVLRERTDENYTDANKSDYYYEYDLYRNGQVETNVKVDSSATLTRGALYNKIKTNSKGWITGQNPIGHLLPDYYVQTAINTATGDVAIDYDNGTITLASNASKTTAQSFVLNTNNIVLLYNNGIDIRKDAGKNYEVYTVNGSELKSYLQDYTYTYSYYAVLNDGSANKIDQLYIYISASNKVVAAGTTATLAALTVTPQSGSAQNALAKVADKDTDAWADPFVITRHTSHTTGFEVDATVSEGDASVDSIKMGGSTLVTDGTMPTTVTTDNAKISEATAGKMLYKLTLKAGDGTVYTKWLAVEVKTEIAITVTTGNAITGSTDNSGKLNITDVKVNAAGTGCTDADINAVYSATAYVWDNGGWREINSVTQALTVNTATQITANSGIIVPASDTATYKVEWSITADGLATPLTGNQLNLQAKTAP